MTFRDGKSFISVFDRFSQAARENLFKKIGYLGYREYRNSFSMPTKIHIKLRKRI